ncbi:hypothetical protein [Moraxella lacunata]|uniref:hypothetical protein n=1 Tax=Moraxella lacunata TaxID=477 RepID=UPI003EE155B1
MKSKRVAISLSVLPMALRTSWTLSSETMSNDGMVFPYLSGVKCLGLMTADRARRSMLKSQSTHRPYSHNHH